MLCTWCLFSICAYRYKGDCASAFGACDPALRRTMSSVLYECSVLQLLCPHSCSSCALAVSNKKIVHCLGFLHPSTTIQFQTLGRLDAQDGEQMWTGLGFGVMLESPMVSTTKRSAELSGVLEVVTGALSTISSPKTSVFGGLDSILIAASACTYVSSCLVSPAAIVEGSASFSDATTVVISSIVGAMLSLS